MRHALNLVSMISPLFNDTQYQSLRTMLDVAETRHRALASNVANVNTPGYQRRDIAATFEEELKQAIKSGNIEKIHSLAPKIQTDTHTPTYRMDGNNVNLEQEMVEIAKNSTQYEVSAMMLARRYQMLRQSITGRS